MAAANVSYRFNVGTFECIAVTDGTLTYTPPTFPPPAAFLFANAPKEQVEKLLTEHNLQMEQWMEWVSSYICLMINTGENRVLVDTGANGLGPNTGRLLQNLQSEGIAPYDIDTVILTHGHPDHIGGNTDGEGKIAFPNARFVMWKDEWDFWNSDLAELKVDEHVKELFLAFARKNLPPIQGKVELVDQEKEIIPGIRSVAAQGHTHGHMALAISSGNEQLLCVSDAVLHPIHVERVEWHAAVDLAHQQVVSTRRRLLKWALDEKALMIAFHFPFPGLGHIIEKGEGLQWQPISTLH